MVGNLRFFYRTSDDEIWLGDFNLAKYPVPAHGDTVYIEETAYKVIDASYSYNKDGCYVDVFVMEVR